MRLALDIMPLIIGERLTNSMPGAKLYQNEAWLRKRIHVDKKTPQDIAKECGVSLETIYVYLSKFKIIKTRRK